MQENRSCQEFHFLVSLIPRYYSRSFLLSLISSFFHTLLINSIHSPHRSVFPLCTSHSIPLLSSSTSYCKYHFISLNHHLHSNLAILYITTLLSTQFIPNPSKTLPFCASTLPQTTPFTFIHHTQPLLPTLKTTPLQSDRRHFPHILPQIPCQINQLHQKRRIRTTPQSNHMYFSISS